MLIEDIRFTRLEQVGRNPLQILQVKVLIVGGTSILQIVFQNLLSSMREHTMRLLLLAIINVTL